MTNICLDHLRKRKVRKEEPAVVDTPEGPLDRMNDFEEEAAHADPERNMWNRQLSGRIEGALSGLTPRERMVFELRHYQGSTAAQYRRDPGNQSRKPPKIACSARRKKCARCWEISNEL